MPLLALALAVGTSGLTMSADLSGEKWRPSMISTSDLPAATRMYVEFKDGGQISGSGGCNHFFGGYTISGNTIKIGPLASTRKGCPGIMRSEVAFFRTLESAKTFAIDGDKLTLFDAAGLEVAEFSLAER